jgi:hypothetical protein
VSAADKIGRDALASYETVLAFLAAKGGGAAPPAAFFDQVPGIRPLYQTMSAAAPAVPGEPDEEWNPLSQRPHAPLAPAVGDELGAEVTALKEAVDGFTTLTHEMLHVALWEPFFAGAWKPRAKAEFHRFSVMAEAFCFFFADIVVTRAVRMRLADGEFALDRRTPSSALFSPVRAFEALGITDAGEILAIYLAGFQGGKNRLWQPRGTSNYAAALAAQLYDFYAGSTPYLDGLYGAVKATGVFGAFYRDFCAVPGIAAFWRAVPDGEDYFQRFFREGLAALAALPAAELTRLKQRRAVQMRAYYALQLTWLLREGLVLAKKPPRVEKELAAYLKGLQGVIRSGGDHDALDARYDETVRRELIARDAWAGQRWLIAPRRAGGMVSAKTAERGKVPLLRTVAFLVDELTRRMKADKTVAGREALLAEIRAVAGIKTGKALRARLGNGILREIWSVPLAAFDPHGNRFRELAFSYQ